MVFCLNGARSEDKINNEGHSKYYHSQLTLLYVPNKFYNESSSTIKSSYVSFDIFGCKNYLTSSIFPLSTSFTTGFNLGNRTISNLYIIGDQDTRPWGEWIVSDIGENFVVKRITVIAGARLSLQFHNHREETWTIVSGQGIATVGEDELNVSVGDVVSIDKRQLHRIHNNTNEELIFVEVQRGSILDENDIVRVKDDFGRPLGIGTMSKE